MDKKKAASWMPRNLLIAQGKATPSPKPHIICYQHSSRITHC
jgi:hypothetical protein